MNAPNINNTQSSGYFSGFSYRKEKEKSMRSLDCFGVEDPKSEYEILKEVCQKEIAFAILSFSSFKFEFSKDKNNNIIYKCHDIKIDNNNTLNINFEQIKKIIPENDILKDNYTKFLHILDQIIERIKADFKRNLSFTITLTFVANGMENSIFNIECKYNLEINNENIAELKDKDILKKGLDEGFNYIINEIKGNNI